MKRVVIVAGTRPEVIKMAPVYFALQKSRMLKPVFLSTGQHREMLAQALDAFGIVPNDDLNLMQPGQSLPDLTARVVQSVSGYLAETRPDALLVQGDTTTVLGAALAACYERVPFGHVEAGLRTHNLESPWPEEMNRRLVSPVARWNFAPTEGSANHLRNEGIGSDSIFVTGNTVIDALLWMRDRLERGGTHQEQLLGNLGIPDSFQKMYLSKDSERPWILATGHRRESFGSGFEHLCQAMRSLVERYHDLGILYPVHLNPNVQEPVNRLLGDHDRIALIPPIGYEPFVWLMNRCHFVLTDSGGVQEEAPSLGKPVLVMRETTERPEGVDVGTTVLVGTDADRIVDEASKLLESPSEYERRAQLANPYGDGMAARKIVEILENAL